MPKYLVIVESPKKAKTLQKFLGKNYTIVASYGHVADLPAKKFAVDIKKQFEPTYEILPGKKEVVQNIVKKAKNVDEVILMGDSDREGESICFDIAVRLPKNVKYSRASTHSITKAAVLKAIENRGDIDEDLFAAFETRRILDRLVGYRTSFPVRQATGGPSAGRVQSATLRFLAEREKEIQAFVSQKYWEITVELVTSKFEKIVAKLKKPDKLKITTKKQAAEICSTLKKGPVLVSLFEKRDEAVKSYAPFTTSTLQQSGSTFLGYSPKKTMKLAQSLFDQGFISYHRTDSRFITPEVIDEMRSGIQKYGSKYLPSKPRTFASKKGSQEAHEAIRPTDVTVESTAYGDEAKIYTMVWKRVIASQVTDAEFIRSKAEFSCTKYILDARGSKRTFDGWQKVWDYGQQTDTYLPELTVGEEVKVVDVKMEEKETQPPSRYSEASTVKKMEQLGIGRPSTFASTLETLKARKYIQSGKGKSVHVTELGIRVTDFLVASDFCFVDTGFTSDMEDKLDQIANKENNKLQVLTDFWDRLKHDIANAKEKKKEMGKTNFPCPECKKKGIESYLKLKYSKWGKFLGCQRYGDKENPCKYIAQVDEQGNPVEKQKKKIEYSKFKCPLCKSKMVVRKSKYGIFLGCEKYPACSGIRNEEGEEIKKSKKPKKSKKT